MSRPQCLVQEKSIRGKWVSSHDIRIARLKGQPEPRQERAIRYVHRQTKEEFLALSGGIGWPGDKPGFAVVVGAQRTSLGGTCYRTLEEAEDINIPTLLDTCYAMWCRWGRECGSVPWFWFADVHRPGFGDFLYQANERIQSRGDKEGEILISVPPHHDKPNIFEIQIRLILDLTRHVGQIALGATTKLLAHFKSFDQRTMKRSRSHNHPALSALGAVVSALHEYQPWLMDARTNDVRAQDYQDYAQAEEAITMRELYGDSDYLITDAMETEEGSRGMVPTVYN